MLTTTPTADGDLLTRESRLPGLALLLEAGREDDLAALAEPAWGVSSARVEYLRYKPHTNCLAKVRFFTRSDEREGYAVAVPPSDWAKLAKGCAAAERAGSLVGAAPELGLALFTVPFDRELAALPILFNSSARAAAFTRCGFAPELLDTQLEPLRYKPERRFVGRVVRDGQPLAVLRAYAPREYQAARKAVKWLGAVSAATSLGAAERYSVLAMSWTPGTALSHSPTTEEFGSALDTLAQLHRHRASKLPPFGATEWRRRVQHTYQMLMQLCPEFAAEFREMPAELLTACDEPTPIVSLHGDAHTGQFIAADGKLSLIDFDNACRGPAEWDYAVLLADVIQHDLQRDARNAVAQFDHVLRGPETLDPERLRQLTAGRLIELAIEPFRHRQPNWPEAARRTLQTAAQLRSAPRSLWRARPKAVGDVGLPWMTAALDTTQAAEQLAKLVSCDGREQGLSLSCVRLLRHKPGRRCVIEYVGHSLSTGEPLTLLGKMDAKPRCQERAAVQEVLWKTCVPRLFEPWHVAKDSAPHPGLTARRAVAHGLIVARPWGTLSDWNMWLQERIEGQRPQPPWKTPYLQQAAQAIGALHQTNLPLAKTHEPSAESRLISKRLSQARELAPQWAERWNRLSAACQELCATLPTDQLTSVHRDYYFDQTLLTPTGVAIVDFDLACRADPAIDLGNFIGCLHDHDLRTGQSAESIARSAAQFLAAYPLDQSPEFHRRVDAYAALTVARHAALCLTLPGRAEFCERVLNAAEKLVRGGRGVRGLGVSILSQFNTKEIPAGAGQTPAPLPPP